jgi:apolipoprotein N-acyltransferase
LLSLESGSPGRAFALGLTTGVVYFTGTLYWISRVMVVYGGLQTPVAVLVNALLVAYLALFPALFALILRRGYSRFGSRALLMAPLVWVATELGRTYLLSGFPWVLLGYSQTTVLPIAQLASVVGVYGVSALVAGASASLAATVVARGQAGGGGIRPRGAAYAPLAVTLILVGAIAGWGRSRVATADLAGAGEPVRVGLVQGNVAQDEKWDPARAGAIFQDYLAMTRRAIAEGAGLVIWPESSTPFRFKEQAEQAEHVRALAREANVPVLVGSDEIERGSPTRYYNSAFLLRPDGTDAGVYRKMHLVPFGEYVPLKRLLFFAAPLVEAAGDFSPGESAALLPFKGHLLSTAICYEIVYPNLVRRFVTGGSELLTTITNDAWFGATSAPYQHFAQASMRAIENGRYLVRAANTGISGVVDPYGRVIAQSRLFEPVVIVREVRLLQGETFYARTGDAFAYVSVIATLAMLVASRRAR